jgi:tRNA nucleotidyltransferase/poly(A) polymerase
MEPLPLSSKNIFYEFTTFRHDVEYSDGRHPTVRFAETLEED